MVYLVSDVDAVSPSRVALSSEEMANVEVGLVTEWLRQYFDRPSLKKTTSQFLTKKTPQCEEVSKLFKQIDIT